MVLELTGPQPGEDGPVDIREHETLHGLVASILQEYVLTLSLRADSGDLSEEFRACDIEAVYVVPRRADLRSHGNDKRNVRRVSEGSGMSS